MEENRCAKEWHRQVARSIAKEMHGSEPFSDRKEIAMETRRIKVELIDEMLGTNPGDPKVHETYIGSKAPDAESLKEELEHLTKEEVVDKGKTIFFKDAEGKPLMGAYHMLGFFKSACGHLRGVKGTKSSKLTAYKKKIDGLVKVYPDADDKSGRFIELILPEGTSIGDCQRPLRAQTMQGERVALAHSETVPAGTSFECDILSVDPDLWPTIEEWLDYGELTGLGQWRNSGKGAFIWRYV